MDQPPRQPSEHLFAGGRLIIAVIQGVVVFGVVSLVYLWSMSVGKTDGQVRTLTFVSLVLANLGLIMVNRSWRLSIIGTFRERRNPSVRWILGVTLTLLAVLVFVPVVRDAFKLGSVTVTELLAPMFAAVSSIAWFEGYKLLHRRIPTNRQ
jgi:Ca2+-transporting ATPase